MGRDLPRRMSLLLALFGHGAMSELSPLSGVKRKLDFGAVRAAFDPGCVKTCSATVAGTFVFQID
jgi:hypothetical protein